MAYCGIMRIEKRRRAAVYGLQIEANRTEQEHAAGRDFARSDINWKQTNNNLYFRRTENWNKEITRQIHAAGVKEKTSSVVLLDALFTASPEFFERATNKEKIAYFKACLIFYIREFCAGDPARLINAVIHLDEATPHLQIASVPLYEDAKGSHLSAKVIMGNRTDYRRRQDRFYDTVASRFGLERGEKVQYEEKGAGEKLILSRAEDAKKHTNKMEWKIAEQERKIQIMKERCKQEELKLQELLQRQDAAEQKMKNIIRMTDDLTADYEDIDLLLDIDR